MKKIGVIILILVLLIVGIFVYKNFGTSDDYYFVVSEIRNIRSDLDDENAILDKETYKDKIITENLLSINYTLFLENVGIKGQVYIDDDKYLYISESSNNLIHKVCDVKFKTMYVKDYKYDSVIVYLISQDDKLYIMDLSTKDISKVYIADYKTKLKITNFVDLDLNHDLYPPGNTLFALFEDGNIYDVNSGIRYSEDIVSLYNNIYVFNDKTMSSVNSRMIEDSDGNFYKIKYVFLSYNTGDFMDENPIIIITEDDKLIYVNKDMTHVYEFNKKIKQIDFDVNYPYVIGNLNITFEDDYAVNIEAACNQYYCINEFAE